MTSPPSDGARDDHIARARFAAELVAVRAARRFTEDRLRGWGAIEQSAVAGLIVSELATNAVRHAGSGFELALERDGHSVRITVSDSSDELPAPRVSNEDATSGYGLNIVTILAAKWGCTRRSHGKEVWVELADDSDAPDVRSPSPWPSI